MRALAKILLYLLVIVLLAAVLSPPLYWLLHGMLDFPFYRYFTRTAQVSALVLLVPLLFWLRIRTVREFGLEKNRHPLRDLATGLGLALAPVVLLGLAYFHYGIYQPRDGGLGMLKNILLSAAVVAVIEEFLFRGVILGLAAKSLGRWPAILLVAVIFGGVHFLRPAKQLVEQVFWWSGFAQIPQILDGAPPPAQMALGFLSLVVAGIILGFAAQATRSLWLPIGLHAGWIMSQQGLQAVGKYRSKIGDSLLPWVGPNVVSGAVPTGLVPVFVLLLTGAAVWFYVRHVSRPERAGGV